MKNETITCKCGIEILPSDSFLSEDGIELCEKCYYADLSQKMRQAGIPAFHAMIREKVPPRFLTTDLEHPKFRAKAWEKIKLWRPTTHKPWLGLISPSGFCKSRMIYMLGEIIAVEMAMEKDHVTAEFMTAQEIKEIAMQQFSGNPVHRDIWDNSPADAARERLASIRKCSILIIDDMSKARLTPAAAEEFFAVIDYRHSHNRTTLWTSNSTPMQIAACLPEDMAAPFAGRLIDCSEIYTL